MASLTSYVQGGAGRIARRPAHACVHLFRAASGSNVAATRSIRAATSIRRLNSRTAPSAAPQSDGAGVGEVEDAWKLLLDFNRADTRITATGTTKEQRVSLREAVLVAARHAYPSAGWDPAAQPSLLMMGVLSGDVRLAVRALRDYATALGVDFVMPTSRVAGISNISSIQGGAYIKYNAASGSATVDEYRGPYRGVLIQFGKQQIGHLPLGLLDEAKAAPPPR